VTIRASLTAHYQRVMMGMGEPVAEFSNNVVDSMLLMDDDLGYALHARLTLSTVRRGADGSTKLGEHYRVGIWRCAASPNMRLR